jgi:hypothetical protein
VHFEEGNFHRREAFGRIIPGRYTGSSFRHTAAGVCTGKSNGRQRASYRFATIITDDSFLEDPMANMLT